MLRQYLFIPVVPDLYCLCGSCSVIPWKARQTFQEGDFGELEPIQSQGPLKFFMIVKEIGGWKMLENKFAFEMHPSSLHGGRT